jgi:hypothetical protein
VNHRIGQLQPTPSPVALVRHLISLKSLGLGKEKSEILFKSAGCLTSRAVSLFGVSDRPDVTSPLQVVRGVNVTQRHAGHWRRGAEVLKRRSRCELRKKWMGKGNGHSDGETFYDEARFVFQASRIMRCRLSARCGKSSVEFHSMQASRVLLRSLRASRFLHSLRSLAQRSHHQSGCVDNRKPLKRTTLGRRP